MVAPDFPDFSAAETARNELWVHPISAVLFAARGRTVRLAIGGSEPVDWCLSEVHSDWFRAESLVGRTIVAQIALLDWVQLDVGTPGELPDPVAPKFRGVLGELARRRSLVRLVCLRSEFRGRIHHVGADYVEFTTENDTPLVVPVGQIAWVELDSGA